MTCTLYRLSNMCSPGVGERITAILSHGHRGTRVSSIQLVCLFVGVLVLPSKIIHTNETAQDVSFLKLVLCKHHTAFRSVVIFLTLTSSKLANSFLPLMAISHRRKAVEFHFSTNDAGYKKKNKNRKTPNRNRNKTDTTFTQQTYVRSKIPKGGEKLRGMNRKGHLEDSTHTKMSNHPTTGCQRGSSFVTRLIIIRDSCARWRETPTAAAGSEKK